MCGRTCCNLCKDVYVKASCHYNGELNKYETPTWKSLSNNGLEFESSINCAPQSVTPVLVSKDHFNEISTHRALVPMLWGMIPPWHSGDHKTHGLSTNNCRIETITSSKLYSPPLQQGKRCVIICEGFYEWQTTTKTRKKQPYFVYAKQNSNDVCVENIESWNNGEFTEDKGWTGPKLLAMAGLFNKWRHQEGGWIYSYSVITLEADNHFSWLHHRVPAILNSEIDISNWLSYVKVSSNQALNLLKPGPVLDWHPVSHIVGNSRNKSVDCNKRIDLSKTEESASSKFMLAWLGKSHEDHPNKKSKLS